MECVCIYIYTVISNYLHSVIHINFFKWLVVTYITAMHANTRGKMGCKKTITSTKQKYLTVIMSSINCYTHHLTQYKNGEKRPTFVNE